MGNSYRMRMYKRRLWQERARILLIGSIIWFLACILVALVVTSVR